MGKDNTPGHAFQLNGCCQFMLRHGEVPECAMEMLHTAARLDAVSLLLTSSTLVPAYTLSSLSLPILDIPIFEICGRLGFYRVPELRVSTLNWARALRNKAIFDGYYCQGTIAKFNTTSKFISTYKLIEKKNN